MSRDKAERAGLANSPSFGACPVPRTDADQVLLGHGSGGSLTAQLIEDLILPAFRNPALDPLDDQAVLAMPREPGSRLAFTTDSYVVTPIFFPGGDIGQLAVNGTINDLAVGGARPLALSLAFILEEGFSLADSAARDRIGERGGGARRRTGRHRRYQGRRTRRGRSDLHQHLGHRRGARRGGAVVTPRAPGRRGPALRHRRRSRRDDHGAARGARRSTARWPATPHRCTSSPARCSRACPGAHAMRDPTRGGLAATLVEIASRGAPRHRGRRSGGAGALGGARRLRALGLDPLLLANEGKLVAFVPEDGAEAALGALRGHPLGRDARRIGRVTADRGGLVVVRTALGGRRILDLPYAEPLPRIC